jgi:hypothetical protein
MARRTGEGTPSGQVPSISTWSEKPRKDPNEHDQSKDADVVQREPTAATSDSSPSRTLRPKSVQTTQWGTSTVRIARYNSAVTCTAKAASEGAFALLLRCWVRW